MDRHVSKYIECIPCRNAKVLITGVHDREIRWRGVVLTRPFVYGNCEGCGKVVDKRLDAVEEAPQGGGISGLGDQLGDNRRWQWRTSSDSGGQ
jgi:hypothetical protein